MKNKLNGVEKDWFDKDDYSAIDEYDDYFELTKELSIGMDTTKRYITIDLFDKKRWFHDKDRRNHIGTFVFRKRMRDGVVAYSVDQASIAKKYQGKGIAAIIYRFVVGQGYNIMSGDSMSPGAAKLWSRLSIQKGLDVLSYEGKKWFSVDDIEPEDVYDMGRLVLCSA